MSFTIKNISSHPVTVFGTIIEPNAKLNLLSIVSGAQIISSLRNGALFELFQGRRLAVTSLEGFNYIGATQDDLDYFSYCGFMQGCLRDDGVKYPFQFTTDGYLRTTASIGAITVEAQNEVEGRVLDGASAAGIKPVIVAGVDVSGNAQNLATTTDGYLLVSSADSYSEKEFIILRAFSSTIADSEPPSSFVSVTPQLGAIEIHLGTMTFGGTVPGSQIRFRIWARNSQGTAHITKVDEFILPASILALPAATNPLLPLRYNIQEDEVAITVTFMDGSSPTITGNVKIRPIAQSSRDDSIVKRDYIDGNQLVKILGYDSLLDALKVVIMNDIYPAIDEPLVIDAASQGTGTVYFPSTDGIELSGYESIATYIGITGAGASVATVSVEAVIGNDWTYVCDITKTVIDEVTGFTLTGPAVSTAGGNLTLHWHRPGLNKTRFRIKLVVSGVSTGAIKVSIRRSKLGAA